LDEKCRSYGLGKFETLEKVNWGLIYEKLIFGGVFLQNLRGSNVINLNFQGGFIRFSWPGTAGSIFQNFRG